jgi:hypothetical protein
MFVSNPERARNYFLLKSSRLTLEPIQPPIQGILGALLGIMRPGHEVDHLHLVRRLMSGALPPLPLYASVAGVETNLSQHWFGGLTKTTKDFSRSLKGRSPYYE